MVFSKYRISVVIGILAILFLAFALVHQSINTKNYYTMGGIVFLLIAIVYWLFYLFDKQSRDLQSVIIRLKEGDYSYKLTGSNSKGKDFAELVEQINIAIRNSRLDSQSRLEYLNRVIEQVDIGLIAFAETGAITLINPSVYAILGVNHLSRINQIENLFSNLYNTLIEVKPQESRVVTVNVNGEDKRLLVRVSLFTLQGNAIRLASFQNIKEELDKGEVESWQKLIRVLTHEITNSVTPIVTTCQGMIREIPDAHGDESGQRFSKGLSIIEQRSSKLIDFVKKFRGFSLIPEIKAEWTNPKIIADGVINLFAEEAKSLGAQVLCGKSIANAEINVDSGLLQQVLINILKNALQSFEGVENPKVLVDIAFLEQKKLMIRITDNGCGIKPQNLDKVFVPFFTTRKEGTGIGLSFSRQVMQLHGGTIMLSSNEGIGTSLSLIFPEDRVRQI